MTDTAGLAKLAARFGAGHGPIALDAERASGFRYGSRAFLVQIRRAGAGTALVDPIGMRDLRPLADVFAESEWILHAATQDLPCLTELGLRPTRLFDTELAGRLAGLPRVGLGPMVADLLGYQLAKGHGADDWSRRPIRAELLTYAALDVELLLELRERLYSMLLDQGKWEWAEQEFAAIVAAPPPEPRRDPWRRTSGIHAISDRRVLAIVREIWTTREEIARARDLSPHRVLPDSAIVGAAQAQPASEAELTALPVFRGHAQKKLGARWFGAIARAYALPATELPPRRLPSDGPPPPSRWQHKDPQAAARLDLARGSLAALSEQISVPLENLASPHLVREVLWRLPSNGDVAAALAAGGARPWQVSLVAPIVHEAWGAHP